MDLNFIGNYAIAGPDTSIEATRAKGFTPRFDLTTAGYRQAALSSNRKTSRIYQSGNKIDSNVNGKLDGRDNGWSMVNGVYTRMDAPFPAPAPPTTLSKINPSQNPSSSISGLFSTGVL